MAATFTDFRKVFNLAATALHKGGKRTGIASVEWDISANCEYPVPITVQGADGGGSGRRVLWVDLYTRCRKCPNCQNARRNLWRYRASNEIEWAHRTWFVTLTLKPEEYYRMSIQAEQKSISRSIKWDALSSSEQFAKICAVMGSDITKYLKRVRKDTASRWGVPQRLAPLRYLVAFEPHKTGRPHAHLLMHESSEYGATERILRRQWRLGHAMANIADQEASHYVSKYISKSLGARVRASREYGAPARGSELVSVNHDLKTPTPPFREPKLGVFELL